MPFLHLVRDKDGADMVDSKNRQENMSPNEVMIIPDAVAGIMQSSERGMPADLETRTHDPVLTNSGRQSHQLPGDSASPVNTPYRRLNDAVLISL